MRHRWQTLLLIALLWSAPRLAAAQCAAALDGVGALADARNTRGVVSDLDLMRAWDAQNQRDMEDKRAELGDPLDLTELSGSNSASWLYWTDSFDGFRLCESNTPVDLDRQWWGAHAKFDDRKTGLGYELFYLAATDDLGFSGDLDDVEYGWRHRIAGAELRYRDWIAVRGGTIDIEAPSRAGEGAHEGSAYLALSIPRFGLGADVLIHPGTKRLNMLMLGIQRTPLPLADLKLSAHGGWLDDEHKGVGGFELTGVGDAVTVQVVVEGAPIRLRSVSTRVEHLYRAVTEDDFWLDAGIAPFLEISAYNGGRFELETGRSLVPGAATGCRAYMAFGVLSAGLEGFVGVNRAEELSRLTRVVDHVHWGGRFYVRIGI